MWFLVSGFTLFATFRGNASDFVGLFLQKNARIVMATSLWNPNIPFLLLLYSAKKVPCICHWNVYCPCKERQTPFLWPNANSICGHKLIEQINTTHLLDVILKRFWDWCINSFFGWLWPPLSCADSIAGNIVGGTSNNFVIQPRHYQLFTIGSKRILWVSLLVWFY